MTLADIDAAVALADKISQSGLMADSEDELFDVARKDVPELVAAVKRLAAELLAAHAKIEALHTSPAARPALAAAIGRE